MQGVIRRGFSPRIMFGTAGAFVLAAFAFSGSAEAATFAKPSNYNAGFYGLMKPLAGGNGTKIQIAKAWGGGGRSVDGIGAQSKTATSDYYRKGKPGNMRIKGNWKGAGKLNLKLKVVNEMDAVFLIKHNRCGKKTMRIKGKNQLVQFSGKIKLKGEKKSFAVRKSGKLWGFSQLLNLPKCARKPEKVVYPKKKNEVFFAATGKKSSVWLAAPASQSSSQVNVTAGTYEKRGKIWVSRTVTQGKVQFSYDRPGLAFAAINAGPRPGISGLGEYERGLTPAENTWTGNLKAHFIGKPNHPLVANNMTVEFIGKGALKASAEQGAFPTAAALAVPQVGLAAPLRAIN